MVMRSMRLVVAAALMSLPTLPSLFEAQVVDSLVIGDRVRVRVAATRGTTNLFIGNVASLARDTLTLSIPGGKGAIILQRAAVSEVAIENGRESRLAILPRVAP
jgi:hypothetical protein